MSEQDEEKVSEETPTDPSSAFQARVDRNLRRLPSVVARSIRTVHTAAPRQFALTAALQVVAGITSAAQIIIVRALLTEILRDQHSHDFSSTVPSIVALAIIVAVTAVVSVGSLEMRRLLSESVGRYCMRQIIRATSSVDLVAFDDPQFHDRLQRATLNATVRPFQMTTGLLDLGSSTLSSVGIGIVLLLIQPLFLVLLLVAVVPLTLTSVRVGRALYDFEVQQTPAGRQRLYLQMLLTEKDPAKEVRAYELGTYLTSWFDDLYDQRIGALRRLVARRMKGGVGAGLITAAITAGALALLLVLVADRETSLASAGSAAIALLVMGTQLQGVASGIGQLFESSLFVQDFSDFLELAPSSAPKTEQHRPLPEGLEAIRAQHIGFTYPSRTRPTLRDVSIEIPAGQVVALVGSNGSGKTTLAKLLAGLYRPSEGRITWGDVDVAEANPRQQFDRIAILFQDFLRYYLSARENITMGRTDRRNDHAAMAHAANLAGATGYLTALPDGFETSLSPQFFGGSDLSGGQWQRLALARAFFRDAELVILDEPTASLDPKSESELFQVVQDLFANRSVLLISHRFATVRFADHIYVLDGGAVLEHGSHDSLMAAGGRYSELFRLQASAFGLGDTSAPGQREPS